MRLNLIPFLQCPVSGQNLALENAVTNGDEIESGFLVTPDGLHRYQIRNFIPRFVPQSNYADNFGMQWNMFRQTQLDSYAGHPISGDRFWRSTQWKPEEIKEKWVLDCGCGAGRFAEVVLEAGANLVAIDYSSAVDACYANLRHYPNLHLIQADIYALPLIRESFPFVYSLGVLQHTPDVEAAFQSLPLMLAPKGSICVDFYEKNFKSKLLPKYWLRPFTKKMDQAKLFASLQKWVPRLWPVSNTLGSIPVIGKLLKRIVPIANYKGILPLSDKQLQEWALLDTFDWLAPQYDNPQDAGTLHRWMKNAHLNDIEVLKVVHLVGRGTKAWS